MNTHTDLTMIELSEGNSYYAFADLPDEMCITDEEFKTLWAEHPEEHGKVIVYGKTYDVPRWQQNYGLGYYFAGLMHEALPIRNTYVKKLLDYINALTYEKTLLTSAQLEKGVKFNQVLVNWYADGNHYIGKHSDDETQLIKNTPIFTVSFGQERDFVIESKKNKKGHQVYRQVVKVKNNSLLIMGGEMQRYYLHSVPKRSANKVKKPRISITFRCFDQKTELGQKRKRK